MLRLPPRSGHRQRDRYDDFQVVGTLAGQMQNVQPAGIREFRIRQDNVISIAAEV